MNKKYQKIIKAVEASGKILAGYFGKDFKRYDKKVGLDFYTQADLKSEDNIIKAITREFPGYNIYGEEKGLIDKKADYTFVIDPLDGTLNLYQDIPYFSATLALLKKDEAVFAVTHNPILKQTFWAIKGQGAFKNGRRVKVNNNGNVNKLTVGYSCGWRKPRVDNGRIINALYRNNIQRVMTNWSPALDFCLLASGKIEAMINDDNELHDNLAGKLMVREAGGKLTDLKGRRLKSDRENTFLASNGTKIHKHLIRIIKY